MKTTRETRIEEATANIINYFKENEDDFNACIEELDGWNGYLNDDRYYTMDMLGEFYTNADPVELLERAFYGYDADTYSTDRDGNRIYGAFNPNRDYFKYNGYGNLVSTDYPDYSDHLDEYTIKEMLEYRNEIYTIDESVELFELFDALEAAQAEDDEEEEIA